MAISDTHSRHRSLRLPAGDVLVHAGDLSHRGDRLELEDFFRWFVRQDFRYKICIAGNHDFFLERANHAELDRLIPEEVIYLNDNGTVIEGVQIWGSPITPEFFRWAFNRKRGAPIRQHWELVPPGTDLLITHGPPLGILDQTVSDQHVGCRDLLHTVKEIKPKVHLFGHIHESHGTTKNMGTRFINASLANEQYELVYKPILFEL